jgi:AraC family L-rhamnose operon transcriptional activator RhaR
VWTATRERLFGWPSVPLHAKHEVRTRTITEHTHHDFAEIAIVAGGRGIHTSAKREVTLERGAVVMLRPGAWHRTDDVLDLEYHNLYLPPELLHGRLSWVSESSLLISNLFRGAESLTYLDESALQRATGWLRQIATSAGRLRPAALVGLAACVLSEFVEPQRMPESVGAARIRSVLTAMNADVGRPWTVQELADRAGISPSYLHREFAAQIGVPLMAWLDRLRGQAAATLLASTDLTVAECGQRVGWTDPSQASRRFRALYDVSPSEYRARFGPAAGGARRG